MNNTSLVYLVAYVAVAGLSTLVPILARTSPRIAGLMQILAAVGFDLPRLADGLRKIATGEAPKPPSEEKGP